jgi:uncharacterized membrane protein
MTCWAILTLLAAICSSVVGGVFFAFSTFVMQALARQTAPAAIRAMQAINVSVINPAFLGMFVGAALLHGALLAGAALACGITAWAIAGALLYLLGAFGVTLAANVPRNMRLAGLDADSEAAAGYWPIYLREWSRWNHVRTTAAILAGISLTLALHPTQG